MKIQYYTASSLDGFIADEANSLDWLFQFAAGPGRHFDEFLAQVGAIAMGSATYQWILEHHVNPGADMPRPWEYVQPTWVFTTRQLPAVPGADIRFVRGDVGQLFPQMAAAAGDKNIWLVGGGELVGQFHDRGLLDELIVCLAAVTLGGGAPVLPRRIANPPLRLLAVDRDGDAIVRLHYAVQRATG